MTVEEALNMVDDSAMNKLKELVDSNKVKIDVSKKVNNDIIMSAFCKAVNDKVIKESSLDDTLIKLLNSSTNTISYSKMVSLLSTVHESQKGIKLVITLKEGGTFKKISDYTYGFNDKFEGVVLSIHEPSWKNTVNVVKTIPDNFITIFGDIIKTCSATPSMIREKMSEILKPTVVNNIAQFVARYNSSTPEEREEMVISIKTITRICNVSNIIITAEFIDEN